MIFENKWNDGPKPSSIRFRSESEIICLNYELATQINAPLITQHVLGLLCQWTRLSILRLTH